MAKHTYIAYYPKYEEVFQANNIKEARTQHPKAKKVIRYRED